MSTDALAQPFAKTISPERMGADANALSVTVYEGLAAAEPAWRTFEQRAVLTPYQRYDWIAAYCEAGFAPNAKFRILEIAKGERTIAIIPLAIAPWMGAARGQVIGTEISNGDFIIVDRDRAGLLTPAAIARAIAAVRGKGTALDMVLFASWTARWQGLDNPLMALPHTLAPNTFYTIDLPAGQGGSFIEEALPHKRRTNIKRSARRLEEQFGPLTLKRAGTRAEIERFHAIFLDQRGKRFKQMGVTNIFAREPFRRLFIDGATTGLGQAHPALRIHALMGGETILATCIGTYANRHYSQYINSTTDGPAAKYTLMGVMMSMLVDELRSEGITSMDMGLGDFDYKIDWTHPEPVYDSILAVSPRGRVVAKALGAARGLKRTVKHNPVAWKIARFALTLKSKLVRP